MSTKTPQPQQNQQLNATATPSVLLDLLTAVGTLVDECKLRLDDEGMHVRAIDPANVGMIDLTLEKEAFLQYNATDSTIGVNIDRLTESLSMIEKGDEATITVDDEGLNLQGSNLEFNLSLIDPDSIRADPDIPDIDHAANATLSGAAFNRGLKAADMISDHLILSGNPQRMSVTMKAEGDTDDVELELDESTLDAIDITDDVESIYSLDYLKDMKKAFKADTELELSFGQEVPMNLNFQNTYESDSEDAVMDVKFMLAPRVAN